MRKSVAAVLATAAALTGLAMTAAPASAAGSCTSGHICLFENNDFNQGNTNHWRDFTKDVYNFNAYSWVGTTDNMDNETSSIKNRGGCTVTLYQDIGYKGDNTDFKNGADDGFLSNNNVGDNRASSLDSWCD
jgi:hypothetical protein